MQNRIPTRDPNRKEKYIEIVRNSASVGLGSIVRVENHSRTSIPVRFRHLRGMSTQEERIVCHGSPSRCRAGKPSCDSSGTRKR